MLLAICDRFRCLPSQAEAEDVLAWRLMALEQMARPLAAEG